MAYATEADILTLYGPDLLARVADRDRDGTPDAAAVAGALDRASAEIDSHIGARYELPLAATPPVLVQLCVDIAVYRLAQSGAIRTEEDRTRYEDAVAHLGRIARGHATLALPEAGDPDDPTEGLGPRPVVTSGPERVFSRDKLRGL
jgi:phage gp36-like protein